MKCRRITKVLSCTNEEYLIDLQIKEIKLKEKEKELLKKERLIQRKICKYKKRKSNRAIADLKAAAKLKNARRNLLLVINAKNACDKGRKSSKPKKCDKTCRREPKCKEKREKLEYWNPLYYFSNLIKRPCEYTCQKCRMCQKCDCCYACPKRGPFLFRKPWTDGKPWFFSKQQKCEQCSCSRPWPSCEPWSCRRRNQSSCLNHRKYETDCSKLTQWQASGDCYLMSIPPPPLPQIYHHWPRYPNYIDAQQCKHSCKCLLLCLAGMLLWAPCFLCLQLFRCCCCSS